MASVAVGALAVVFVSLGLWQLDRHAERQADNALGEERLSQPPVPLEGLLLEAQNDLGSIEYRRSFETGRFDVSSEVLIRSQVHQGASGFHVITPLITEHGGAVLVNRGWVPLPMDSVPVAEAAPDPLVGRVDGWVHRTQTKPALGPADPADGNLEIMNRVDIDRIQDQVDYPLEPVYLVMESSEGDLPIPSELPDFENEGPHLAYAFQWFGFAVVVVVGFVLLMRNRLRRTGSS